MGVALEPLQLLPATVAGVLYALRTHGLAGTPRAVPGWRRLCFNAGLVLIVATLTLLGDLGDELFWAHMVEHLVMADLGALLRVLGLPVPALALWALNLYAWHVPGLHEAAVRHEGVHALQHACFVAAAV